MKKLYKYIALVIGIVAFNACTDEVDFPKVVVEEGKDVTLNLKVQLQDNNVVESRTNALAKENQLFDLHFYVFNSGGDLTGYTQATAEDMAASPGPEEVTINAKSGANSTIYALANIKKSVTYYLDEDQKTLLTDPFNNRLTKSQLLSMRFNRRSASEGKNYPPTPSDSVFMMSGYLNDGQPVNIGKNGSVSGGDGTIKLYRLLAKNELKINTVEVEETITEGNQTKQRKKYGQFIPRSYRFHNVPTGGMLVPNANITTANGASDTYTGVSGYYALNEDSVESNYMLQTNDSTLTFYFPENLQATVSGIEAWKNRETNDYATGKKAFSNAPANAGYIEIQGDYVGKIEEKSLEADSEYEIVGDITAAVTYTIHLGNFSQSKRNSVKFGDFNVVRNNFYKYNVSVNGVNDIIAEATVVDNNPYAEGLVVNAIGSTHLNVDAHYEARVMTFTRDVIDIVKSNNGQAGYFINIETPFWKTAETYNVRNNGVYKGNSPICTLAEIAEKFGNNADYDWVKFVRNDDNPSSETYNMPEYATGENRAKRYPCKFPGEDSDTKRKYIYQNGEQVIQNPRGWMTVFELLAELYTTRSDNTDIYGDSGEVYYTCFIDENYYPERAWTEYVNKEPRTMLIANKLDVSQDGKSLYAKVEYGISQRSIATFYLKSDSVAFGTETYDEEELFGNELGDKGTDDKRYGKYKIDNKPVRNHQDWNARASAVASNAYIEGGNTEVSWYGNLGTDGTYVDNAYINNIENVQPLYKAVAKACMSRNRDYDGDGIIEENEIKWYLASVGQYRALYFAQNVLPVDSRLISIDDLTAINNRYGTSWGSDTNGHDARGDYHYWTCSAGNAATFWPEEGLTNNPVGPVNPGNWVSRAELVRCVRSLQSGSSGQPSYGLVEPQKYYTLEKEPITYTTTTGGYRPQETTVNDTIYTFIMDGIKVNRSESNAPLSVHHELDDENDFTYSFVVAVSDLSGGTKTIENITKATDYCLEYKNQSNIYADDEYDESDYEWRTPNQKEFALMYAEVATLKNSTNVYGMRTQFSGSNKSDDANKWGWHTAWGFAGDGGRINLNSNNANLRCVRDVLSNK